MGEDEVGVAMASGQCFGSFYPDEINSSGGPEIYLWFGIADKRLMNGV
ncbi:hypothetical protein AB1K70_09025 [Bremerella sp. JC770]